MHLMLRVIVGAVLAIIALHAIFALILAFPGAAFRFSYAEAGIVLHADRSQNDYAARAFLRDVATALDQSPLGPPERDLHLYSSGGLRAKLFFAPVSPAGGTVYVPLSARHAFLRRLDLKGNRLIKGDVIIDPPRTAQYYAVHELSHLRVAEIVGPIRFHTMPAWVREGLPDFIALGAPGAAEAAKILAWDGPPVPLMIDHGSYPLFRVLVDFAVNRLGWDMAQLLATDLDAGAMRDLMRKGGG